MEIIGWVGAALVLGAYALISAKRVHADDWRYQMMNVVGALSLAVYAWWHGAIASVAVNIIWLGIGVIALFRLVRLLNTRGTFYQSLSDEQ